MPAPTKHPAGIRERAVRMAREEMAEAGYQIAPSSYYAHKSRRSSARALADTVWDERITTEHADNRSVHGARKTWKGSVAYPPG